MYNFVNTDNIYAFLLLAIWEWIWKGLALWRAARNNQPKWFVVLLLINSVGVLSILYLRFFSHPKKENQKK